MRFQWKVVVLVFVVVFVTATAIIWRTQNQVVADRMSFVADSAMKQSAPLKRLVDEKLADAQRELVRFAASRAVSGPGRETDFGPFDVIALIESGPGAPAPTWTERGATARAESWPAGHELTLLKSLPYGKVRDGQRHWVRVADGRGSAVFAVVVPVEVKASEEQVAPTSANLPDSIGTNRPKARAGRAYIVGFTTRNPLAAITEDFIGSTTNVYVVDDRGYVASHVDKSYNGALFTEDPVVVEIMKAQKAVGSGRFEDLESRPVLAHYEKVDDSNLTVIVATSLRTVTAGTDDHLQTALFTAIGVGLLAAIAAWFAGGLMSPPRGAPVIDLGSSGLPSGLSEEDEPLEPLPLRTISPPAELPTPKSVSFAPPPEIATDASLQNERKLAFEAFHEGVGKQMRDPLLSIIGHAQLLRANAGGDEKLQAHVESIERDARNAKEALDRLRLFEEADLPLEADETFDLEDVITRTLEAKDIDLQAAGVKVERALGTIPRLKGRASDFTIAVGHMIDNAIEAMRDRPVRRLTIKTEAKGDHAVLSIGDTGVGMSRDVKNRAFEPFFKNFESPLRMGLGLSFVHAAAHRADAKCDIDSTPGDGTVVSLKFPLPLAHAELPPPTEAQLAQMSNTMNDDVTQDVIPDVTQDITQEIPEVGPVVAAKPAPALPKVPPPPAAPPPIVARDEDDEDDAFKAAPAGLTLGGRGPVTEGLPLPPLPYPKLERAPVQEATEPTDEEKSTVDWDSTIAIRAPKSEGGAVDWDSTIAIKIPKNETPEHSVIHQFGREEAIVTPAPQPSAPEAIEAEAVSEVSSIDDMFGEPTPAPEAPAPAAASEPAGKRPFRVRIRPPKTRGPTSQA